jgi:hypothetical protein
MKAWPWRSKPTQPEATVQARSVTSTQKWFIVYRRRDGSLWLGYSGWATVHEAEVAKNNHSYSSEPIGYVCMSQDMRNLLEDGQTLSA